MNGHLPVMVDEVIAGLQPKDGGIYIDGTFGAGGYSMVLLEAAASRVWGIDRDPHAVTLGIELSKRFDGRFTILDGKFGEMRALMADEGIDHVDGIALDVGVSSNQLDNPARGFSFRADGPLDMRMGASGPTAADIVNQSSEGELADIIHQFGGERYARRIARAIVGARGAHKILTTGQLADVVRGVVRRSKDGVDPATRTFLALRIKVNDELAQLEAGLAAAEWLLVPGGRLAVVSFHSLEDRRAKNFLRDRSGTGRIVSRHLPVSDDAPKEPSFRLIRRGVGRPSDGEIRRNPRARSARLRLAERTEAPAWSVSAA